MNCNINCDKLDTLKTLLAKDSIIQSHLAIVWRRLMIRFHGVQLSIYLIDQWQGRQHSRKEVLTLDREHDCVFFSFSLPFLVTWIQFAVKKYLFLSSFFIGNCVLWFTRVPLMEFIDISFRTVPSYLSIDPEGLPFLSVCFHCLFLAFSGFCRIYYFFFSTAATWLCRCFFPSWNDRYPMILI